MYSTSSIITWLLLISVAGHPSPVAMLSPAQGLTRYENLALVEPRSFFGHVASLQQRCLAYEPKVVKLIGVVKQVIAAGPPNYESVRRGDAPERIWVLRLNKPVCISTDAENKSNTGEAGVQDLQLVINEYDRYRALLGQRVVVKGQLSHATTGHHHTAVLLAVKDIKLARTVPARAAIQRLSNSKRNVGE